MYNALRVNVCVTIIITSLRPYYSLCTLYIYVVNFVEKKRKRYKRKKIHKKNILVPILSKS